MTFRNYNPELDDRAVARIWKECGWLDGKEEETALKLFLGGGRNLVAELNGEAECLASARSGTLRYLGQDLSFSAVVGVTTSRVARKQGLARRLTAQIIAEEAASGAAVSGLGIFDSGFYDQLGYGLGSYELIRRFDPSQLVVGRKHGVPLRLDKDDHQRVTACMAARYRCHGGVVIEEPCFMQAEMAWPGSLFGLGYEDSEGRLSHFIWCKAKGEGGPYHILAMAWQNREQLLELLALIRSLGDQVVSVLMTEHPEVQLQQMLDKPLRLRSLTRKAEMAATSEAMAYWQARICQLEPCITAMKVHGEALDFCLLLEDPVSRFLGAESPWQGNGGEYTIHLGIEPAIKKGLKKNLPVLETTVGTFTRLWLGVQSASGLCLSDAFKAPPELVHALDQALCLPRPSFAMDF